MGPKRKKSRQNSQAPIASQSTPANQIRNNGNSNDTGISKRLSIDSMQPQKAHDSPNSTATSARGSWYGGSWRSKASPVAQVARESISVAGGATSESSAEDSAQRPALYMTPSFKKSRKSIPTIAEATRVNATGSNTEAARSKEKMPEVEEETEVQGVLSKTVTEQVGANPPLPPDPSKDGASIGSHQSKPSQEKAGWFGWWSRPDGFSEDGDKSKDAANAQGVVTEAGETPLPLSPQVTRTSDGRDPPASRPGGEADSQSDTTKVDNSGQNEMLQIDKPAESGRSWFGLWSASQNEQAKPQTQEQTQESQKAVRAVQNETEVAQSAKQIPAPEEPKTEAKDSNEDEVRPPSSGWAFWSKEKAKESRPSSSGADKQVGELAVADTPSQSHPEAAQFNAEREKAKRASRPSSVKDGKAGKSKADESVKNANNIKLKPEDGTKSTSTDNAKSMRPPTVDAIKFDVASGSTTPKLAKGQQSRPNLIIPSFQTTYPSAYIPTYWERFGLYVASSLRLAEYPPAPEHVSVAPTLPKVKNAIAIGVHGYFPAPLIQKVLGQPTGTSIRFANHASAAIRSWVEQHQPETPCEVEQVALEGEGYIADRVTTLWKLMLNWLSHLRKADLIYVACHSQGVPVAIMLVAKLIQLGCLNPTAKIGICAMAGVNLGPFADYKSRYIGGAAAELFEFSDSHSRVSRDYASSLEVVLRHGVRISYIGSIDDQLVSLESSLFSNLTHPYVQRAVFVDGRLHTPDFISHLVGFALKLRNLGISDHGLIRELSLPLAGSIYGGEGHSRIYNDVAVYDVALQFTLETTDVDPRTVVSSTGSAEVPKEEVPRTSSERRRSTAGIPSSTLIANNIRRGSTSASVLPGVAPQIAPYEVPTSGANANPYFLPWAMRGILEEEAVKKDMQDEVKELVNLFEDWRPASKPLRDVRFRLEAVKSKL